MFADLHQLCVLVLQPPGQFGRLALSLFGLRLHQLQPVLEAVGHHVKTDIALLPLLQLPFQPAHLFPQTRLFFLRPLRIQPLLLGEYLCLF